MLIFCNMSYSSNTLKFSELKFRIMSSWPNIYLINNQKYTSEYSFHLSLVYLFYTYL